MVARRASVSSTDLAAILGLSPYRSEADLADEKLNGDRRESTLPMRIGLALEPVIRDEYERQTGTRLRRVRTLARHPRIPWAVASPRLRRGRPAQARRSEVDDLAPLERRPAPGRREPGAVVSRGRGLARGRCGGADRRPRAVGIPRGIRRRHRSRDWSRSPSTSASGSRPGARSAIPSNRSSARYPVDDGSELVAGGLVLEAVTTLLDVRGRRKALEVDEERLEILIKESMGEASTLIGSGFRVTWKRTKDREEVDWRSVADGLLRQLPETERDALVGIATTVRPGFRPFRVVVEGGSE